MKRTMSSYRKKWDQSLASAAPQIASKSSVPSQNVHTKTYDQYLAVLQERNRLLKKLREKDAHQIELEKREQGFALYLNGANLSQARPHPQAPPSKKSRHPMPTSDVRIQPDQKRPSKTADSSHVVFGEGFDHEQSRAKTAPSKRKSWIHDSVELRTEDGDPIHVKAPGMLSGKYEEDFETILTAENASTEANTTDSPNLTQDCDSNDIARPRDEDGCSEGAQSDCDESAGSESERGEEEDDTLTVSFQDISTLRRSLEQDEMIRESLASERNNNKTNDFQDGDSLSSSSSEDSCAEEIEDDSNSDPNSTSFQPKAADASVAPPDLADTDGIVLQFAKSNHPSTRNQVTKEKLIQLSPVSTVSTSNVMYGATHSLTEQGVEWMESEESQVRLATQSLSAVKRKEQHKKFSDGGETCDVDEVLQALKMENESLNNQHLHIDSNFQLSDNKHGDLNKGSGTLNVVENSSIEMTNVEGDTNSASSTVESAAPRIKAALLPFKPVLVNRYKQATATAKTLVRPRDITTKTTTPLGREEESTVAQRPRQAQPTSEIGGREIPRESLTEHTVKIITDKVRQMDARKQRRLLHLLTRLDRQVSPAPPPPKSPQDDRITTTSSKNRRTVAMTVTSEPNPASPPSWLRSKSIDLQDLNSRVNFDDRDATHNIHSTRGTRSSRVRSQQLMQQEVENYAEISKSQPNLIETSRGRIADIIGESFMYSELETSKSQPTSRPNSRPMSGRRSGIRGVISSAASGLSSRPDMSEIPGGISNVATSRPTSSRISGIRGELHSRQKSRLDSRSPLSSASDSHLPTFLDAKTEDREPTTATVLNSGEPQRLQTAVLAKGRRALQLNASGSDTCLVPCIGGDDDDNHNIMATPTLSHVEPGLSSTHFDADQPRPPHHSERQSLNECLESISKFDHLHLGQMGSNIQDDVLESFLSEYREKRQHRQQKSAATLVGEGSDPFDSTDHSYFSSTSTTATDTANIDWAPTPTNQQRDDGGTSRDMEDSFEEEEGDDYYFATPEHPQGTELVLNLLSTWGDKFYIGLTGIEVYTSTGQPASIIQISADPADINVLPEYSSDPRVVSNLLDGVNQTRDDLHMWLAPFTPGHAHIIRIVFSKPTTLAMIRIWNYNKSRIHSSRGARLVEMYLDGRIIFQGEIARASGGVGGAEGSETILFTTDSEVLSLVADHDPLYQEEVGRAIESSILCEAGEREGEWEEGEIRRPQTADRDDHSDVNVMQQYSEQRPFTMARTTLLRGEQNESIQHDLTHDDTCMPSSKTEQDLSLPHSLDFKQKSSNQTITGRVIELCLTESWGDPGYIGLTSVELLQADTREPLCLRDDQLSENTEGRVPHIAVLVDGVNQTTNTEHMYLCPCPTTTTMMTSSSGHVTIMFTLDTPTQLYGMRVWNYNASLEDTYKGVKVVHVYVDGECVSPQNGYLIRRAPGHTHYDYGQSLAFQPCGGENLTKHHTTVTTSQTDSPLPKGFVYQLQLLSSWGDPYYIGLNGLEIYDETGQKIHLSLDNIAAFPESVNVLPGVKGDLRTVDKLIDGVYDSRDGRHMWLAPILPHIVNSVYVIFDQPRTVSQLRLWNYAKTPSRGVKEFALLVDDLLVYSGTLPPIPSHAQGILPTIRPPMKPHIVTLTDSDLCSDDDDGGRSLQLEGAEFGEEIQFTNNCRIIGAPSKPIQPIANQDLRPLTSLTSYTHRLRSKMW